MIICQGRLRFKHTTGTEQRTVAIFVSIVTRVHLCMTHGAAVNQGEYAGEIVATEDLESKERRDSVYIFDLGDGFAVDAR